MVYKESIRSILNTAIEILEEDSFPFQYDKQLTVLDLVLSKLTNSHRDIASEDPNIQDAFKSIIDEVEKYKSTQHISLFFTHSPELQHLSYDEKVKLIIDESIKYFTEKQEEIASKHQEILELLSLSPNAQNEQIKQKSRESVDEADIRRKLSTQHKYSLTNEDIEKLVAAEIERLAKKVQAKYQTAVEIYLKPAQAEEIAARYKDGEEKAFQEEIKRSKKAMLQPKANQNSADLPNFVQAKLLTMDQTRNFSHESQTIYSAYFGSNPEQVRRYFKAIKDFYSCDEERGIKEISEMSDARIGSFLTDKAALLLANKIISPADAAICRLFEHARISQETIGALSSIKSVCVAQKVFQQIKDINIQLEEGPNREDSVNRNIESIRAQAATLANEYISRSEQLIEAIKAKDSAKFKHLISSGALINYIDNQNKSILEHSFEADFAEGITEIINTPIFDINIRDSQGNTILMNAVRQGRLEAVKAILKHPKVNVNLANFSGKTAICMVAGIGRQTSLLENQIFCELIKHPSFDFQLPVVQGALQVAIWYNKEDIIIELIKHPSFDFQLPGAQKALEYAIYKGKKDVIIELIKHPSFNLQLPGVQEALKSAVLYNRKDIIVEFIKHPSFDFQLPVVQEALKSAVLYNRKDIIVELIKHPNFDWKTKITGDTVVWWLIVNGRQDLLKDLQAKGRKISLIWLDRYVWYILLPIYNFLKKTAQIIGRTANKSIAFTIEQLKQPRYIQTLIELALTGSLQIALLGVHWATILLEVSIIPLILSIILNIQYNRQGQGIIKGIIDILKVMIFFVLPRLSTVLTIATVGWPAIEVLYLGLSILVIAIPPTYLLLTIPMVILAAVDLVIEKAPAVFQKVVDGARACGNAVQYVAQYTAQKVVDGTKYCGNIMKSAAIATVDSVKAFGNAIYSTVDYSKSCVVSSLKNIKDFLFVRPSIVSHANVEASQQKSNQQAPTLRERPSAGAATHGRPSFAARIVSRLAEACNTR